MKKSLLIALCYSMFIVGSLNAKTETLADIYLKSGTTTSIKPLSVGATTSPVTAGIDGSLLNVNFAASLGNTTITIEDSFGEVVYQQTLSVKGAFILPISLAGEEQDTYTLKVQSGSKSWYGEFDLFY
ncbi:DUF3244 domain-containing protein [Bacteroides sedimenti]